MPNPNAIVSTLIRLDPPLDRAPAELLRAERGISVELDDRRRVRLDPANPRSVGFAQILDGLSRQALPVYLEIDPASSSITRLLIPFITRVVRVQPAKEELEVEIEFSQGRHVLRRGAPDFAELETRLRESMKTANAVILTEDDDHAIIDIRDLPHGLDRRLPPRAPRPEVPRWRWPFRWLRDLLLLVWRCRWWPWWWFTPRCMSPVRAQQVFDAMGATTCNPLTVPVPCIPFMYPDDGCWGRAHEMSRLMIQMGVSPKKVWIQRVQPGLLHVNTRNNPNCFVEWFWHVAPTICVWRRRWWRFSCGQEMVIDPSMFTTPVTKATWKAAQNNPGATLTDSDWTIFYLWGSTTDPTYAQTNQVLATYRLQLQLRSQSPAGPPPYAACP